MYTLKFGTWVRYTKDNYSIERLYYKNIWTPLCIIKKKTKIEKVPYYHYRLKGER
jgi:hypothetical protein